MYRITLFTSSSITHHFKERVSITSYIYNSYAIVQDIYIYIYIYILRINFKSSIIDRNMEEYFDICNFGILKNNFSILTFVSFFNIQFHHFSIILIVSAVIFVVSFIFFCMFLSLFCYFYM